MTLDQFEQAWRADTSGRGPAVAEELTGVLRAIERGGKFRAALQNNCAVITTVATIAIVVILGRGGVNWAEVAPVIALQLIAAVTLVVLIRRRIERRRRIGNLSASVSNAARIALRDVRERIAELKALAGYGCLAAVLLALGVYQLYLSGKMNSQAVAGFAMLAGAVLLVNAIVWGVHCRRSLLPRRRRIEAIVSSLGEPQ